MCESRRMLHERRERRALTTKIAGMVSVSKFTIDIQCPHFYQTQIQLR